MDLVARVTDDGTQQLLADHIGSVAEACRRLVGRKQLSFDRLSAEELSDVAHIIGAAHDFGKGTTFFQRYIAPDGDYSGNKKNHASLSAYFAYFWAQQEGFGDEIALLAWYVVQRHHGDLTNLFGEGGELHRKAEDQTHREVLLTQSEDIADYTESALKTVYEPVDAGQYIPEFLERMQAEDIVTELTAHRFQLHSAYETEDYYLVLLLYSVLLDADRTNSAGISFQNWPSVGLDTIPELDTTLVDEYKSTALSVDSTLDEQREAAYEYVDRRINSESVSDQPLLSLTMPTGSGKTLTALNAALARRAASDRQRPDRVIYSVPFLSIIDQNHGVYEQVLDTNGITPSPNVLLRHDHTSAGYASGPSAGDDTTKELLQHPDRALLLTEGWNAEMVTTTFVQFFETILTRRSANARRFHKLANAVVILDEIQAVPTKYWGPIRTALKRLTETFNTTVVMMTATDPLLFDDGEITELTAETDQISQDTPSFDAFDRVTYDLTLPSVSIDDLVDELIDRVAASPEEDVMVVCNTVHASRELYTALREAVDRRLMYLSTNVVSRHRKQRIEEINEADEPLLLVTTQLVEAGVDIDFDTIYRDFAPIDSLVQTAGRCNREATADRGEVNVIKLRDERSKAPRDFHYEYVYDAVLTTATEEVLEAHPTRISEAEFNESATNAYFEKVNDRKETDAEDILPAMGSLAAEDIDPRLVEQAYRTVPVYVMIDEEAQAAYRELETVFEQTSGFGRSGKLESKKARFYANVINVAVSGDGDELSQLAPTFIEEMRLVRTDQIGSDSTQDWYAPDTGFQVPD